MISTVDNITVLPEGQVGAVLLISGRWNANKEYVRDSEVIPLVEYDGLFYSLNKMGAVVGGLNPKDDYAQHGNKATWKLQNSYEMIIVKAVVADGGLLGDFVFWGGKMFSKQGVDRQGNFSDRYTEYPSGNFIPNYTVDAITGEIIALKGKFGLLEIADSNLIGKSVDGKELVRITGDKVPDEASFDAPFDIEDVSFPRETGDYPFSFENGKLTYIEVMYSVDIDLKESGEYRLDECSCDFFEIVNTWNGQNEINHFHITYSADVYIIMGKDVLLDKTFKYTDRWDGVDAEFYTAKKGRCRVNIVFTIIFDRPDGGDYIAKTITGIRALSHKATPYKATFIGSDGLYSSFTTKEFLHYKAGQGITIRSGDYGLRISQNGIQKWNGSKWIAANI